MKTILAAYLMLCIKVFLFVLTLCGFEAFTTGRFMLSLSYIVIC